MVRPSDVDRHRGELCRCLGVLHRRSRAHLAWLGHDVNDGWLAALDDLDGTLKRRAELIRLCNWAEALDAQCPCQRGEV